MRHRVSGRKFNRPTAQRKALLRGLVRDLLLNESIRTTEAKAKEARPPAEHMITLGKDGSLHARRQALAFLNDKDVVSKVFDEIAPRYTGRTGGYTRIVKIGHRGGDGAPVALLELLPQE
jgi:large subunit ribosomal protein L17